MTLSLTVPDGYGYVVLTSVVGQYFVSTYLGVEVMKARKAFNVPYPNLYATPGFHKQADEFNRVQRGHQNMYETSGIFSLMSLFSGLRYPTATSLCSVMYLGGCILYLWGYADTSLKVETARYKKGGAIKWVGFLGVMVMSIMVSGEANGWW